MPEFILNTPGRSTPPRKSHPFYDLSTFAKGYVEAMFFTNGDTGDEREYLLNEWGVEKLTRLSVAKIADDCEAFEKSAAELLALAYSTDEYDDEQAGRDFWFSRQGHGVGFWDRKPLERKVIPGADGLRFVAEVITATEPRDLGDLLHAAAKKFGECDVQAYRGWVHVR